MSACHAVLLSVCFLLTWFHQRLSADLLMMFTFAGNIIRPMIPVKCDLVSDDVALVKFCCDLPLCKGACCVAGDAGAPLEIDEIHLIQENLDEIIPYMTPEGAKTVEDQGVFDYDAAGKYVTPLIGGRECAFVYFSGKIARCAIEKAYDDRKILIRKPVSCHLYPIRITSYQDFDAVNYHKWSICNKALQKGSAMNLPLYAFLKAALIRKYGQVWYNELVESIHLIEKKKR